VHKDKDNNMSEINFKRLGFDFAIICFFAVALAFPPILIGVGVYLIYKTEINFWFKETK
jgi:hypothetical protein